MLSDIVLNILIYKLPPVALRSDHSFRQRLFSPASPPRSAESPQRSPSKTWIRSTSPLPPSPQAPSNSFSATPVGNPSPLAPRS